MIVSEVMDKIVVDGIEEAIEDEWRSIVQVLMVMGYRMPLAVEAIQYFRDQGQAPRQADKKTQMSRAEHYLGQCT